ncbi:MAG: hypothetical protein AAFW84_02080 [Cyanobacteria bacterium J06635_15]
MNAPTRLTMQTTKTFGTCLLFCLSLSFILCERPYGGPSRSGDEILKAHTVQVVGANG